MMYPLRFPISLIKSVTTIAWMGLSRRKYRGQGRAAKTYHGEETENRAIRLCFFMGGWFATALRRKPAAITF